MVDINYYDSNGRPNNTGNMQSVLAVFGNGENAPETQRKIQDYLRTQGYDPNGADWDRWDIPKIVQGLQAAVPEYKMPSQTFNIVKNAGVNPVTAPAITGEQIMGAANNPTALRNLTSQGEAATTAQTGNLSAMMGTQGAGNTFSVPQDDRQRALAALGVKTFGAGEGVALEQKLGLSGDWWNKPLPDNAINYAIDNEIANQQSDPSYGSLMKTYKDPTPFSVEDFKQDPGYKFRMDEGMKALDRAQAARGNFYSGRALKEAADYTGGLADQGYNDAYTRYNNDYNIGYQKFGNDQNNLYNRLTGLVNSGQGAVNTGVNANAQNADSLGNIYGQAGNAKASSTLAGAANTTNAIGSLSQYLGGGNNSSLPWQKIGFTNPLTGRSY